MKLRFNSFDIVCGVTELQSLVGLRVNQIYDVDNKTYLIRLQGGREAKHMLLIESGIRFHTTAFEWPKNVVPSGFSMKLRKHLKNKRLEKLQQLGVDRVVDFQFGIGEAAYHVIVELYDRGNIILTDHEMVILYILRPRQKSEDIRFIVHEKYLTSRDKIEKPLPNETELKNILSSQSGDSLKHIILPLLDCGPIVIEHVLIKYNLNCCIVSKDLSLDEFNCCGGMGTTSVESKKKLKWNKKTFVEDKQSNLRIFDIDNDMESLMQALQDIKLMMDEAKKSKSKGYILQKKEEKPITKEGEEVEHFYQNMEYHPYNFHQFAGKTVVEFETFMQAVDEFYSTLEGQKIDMRTLQQERDAVKKLLNVKKDHAKRLQDLNKAQEGDQQKAELITINQELVDNAILAIRSAIANQMSWPDIQELVKAAQANCDPVAGAINQLKLEINHISLKLSDPYVFGGNEIEDVESCGKKTKSSVIVDVDLALSAWANARKYYDQKRSAAQKERKTIDAAHKALKSAERKTQQTLKEVRKISTISKARKVYWFEKFYWFISSENFLVIGGRDAQQNELIVKRYMRLTDIYVHADIQGASSVVIRNPNGSDVPPKTLLEAGTMAISYSVAWDAKVVTNAYWVRSDQVSKTAPSGEYLGTGSFMIRGKKNFLPSCHLIMGISLLFKLEDSFVEKHRGERKIRSFEEEQQQTENRMTPISQENENVDDIVEEELENDSNENDDEVNELAETKRHDNVDGKSQEFSSFSISEFPDTHVKVEHSASRIIVKQIENCDNFNNFLENEEGESTIIPAAPSRKKQQQNSKKRREGRDSKYPKHQGGQLNQQQSMENKNNLQAVKRGQKSKLKKIKAKYKDQDDEERQLRMQILKSAGKNNKITSNLKLEESTSAIENVKSKRLVEHNQIQHESECDIDDASTNADIEMIDSLTGQPFDKDELLFVIPVVAPYQSLQNYKFKIKLIPGTGKRGRASKTALTVFSRDKICTPREKDLLKSIRDETVARNIPGKVKLCTPQLLKCKK